MKCDVDVLLARAQVGLAVLFSTGFIGVIYLLLIYHSTLSDTQVTIVTGVLGVLGTIVTQQSGYFFARSRPHTPADPQADSPPLPQAGSPPP